MQLLQRGHGRPAEVVRLRIQLIAGRVTESDQIGVQLPDIRPAHRDRQRPVRRHLRPLQQNDRAAADVIQDLPLADHPAHRRQTGDRTAGLIDHLVAARIPQRAIHRHPLGQRLPRHHRRRGRGAAVRRRGLRRAGTEQPAADDTGGRQATTGPGDRHQHAGGHDTPAPPAPAARPPDRRLNTAHMLPYRTGVHHPAPPGATSMTASMSRRLGK